LAEAKNDLVVPKATLGDYAHLGAKTLIASFAGDFGAAAELLQLIIEAPLERKKEEWMQEIGIRVVALEDNSLTIEDLQNNDLFLSAVLMSNQAALKTTSEQKRQALANATINTALGKSPNEAIQHIFFNLVDTFSELHLKVLTIARAPKVSPSTSIMGFESLLVHNLPELAQKRDLLRLLWGDLERAGLVEADALNATLSGHELSRTRLTRLGVEFIEFITAPSI
jgi:hypothetical protein